MIVILSEDGAIDLEDAHDFGRFSLALAGTAPASSPAVDLEEGFAWVSVTHLRAFPGLAGDQGWQDGLSRMIEFAAGRGWVDVERDRIRAHVAR